MPVEFNVYEVVRPDGEVLARHLVSHDMDHGQFWSPDKDGWLYLGQDFWVAPPWIIRARKGDQEDWHEISRSELCATSTSCV